MLRVKPSGWIAWLEGQGIAAPKRAALQALKDAGLVQRVYPLPKHPGHPEAKSFGLYTGKATPATGASSRGGRARRPSRPRPRPEPPSWSPGSAAWPAMEASTLQVGDACDRHHTTHRTATGTGESGGLVIGQITAGPGGRIQAREANGKMIRSFAPDTKAWRRSA